MSAGRSSAEPREPLFPVSDWQRLLPRFAPAVRIAHQVPGRVRLKFDADADTLGVQVQDIPAAWAKSNTQRLCDVLASTDGVHDIRVNLLARSCVVTYDPHSIPDTAWADLLAGEETAAAQSLLARVIDTLREVRV